MRLARSTCQQWPCLVLCMYMSCLIAFAHVSRPSAARSDSVHVLRSGAADSHVVNTAGLRVGSEKWPKKGRNRHEAVAAERLANPRSIRSAGVVSELAKSMSESSGDGRSNVYSPDSCLPTMDVQRDPRLSERTAAPSPAAALLSLEQLMREDRYLEQFWPLEGSIDEENNTCALCIAKRLASLGDPLDNTAATPNSTIALIAIATRLLAVVNKERSSGDNCSAQSSCSDLLTNASSLLAGLCRFLQQTAVVEKRLFLLARKSCSVERASLNNSLTGLMFANMSAGLTGLMFANVSAGAGDVFAEADSFPSSASPKVANFNRSNADKENGRLKVFSAVCSKKKRQRLGDQLLQAKLARRMLNAQRERSRTAINKMDNLACGTRAIRSANDTRNNCAVKVSSTVRALASLETARKLLLKLLDVYEDLLILRTIQVGLLTSTSERITEHGPLAAGPGLSVTSSATSQSLALTEIACTHAWGNCSTSTSLPVQGCAVAVTCRNAHMTVDYAAGVLASGRHEHLLALVSALCKKLQTSSTVKVSGHTEPLSQSEKTSACSELCPPVSDCPRPYAVVSNSPDMVGIAYRPCKLTNYFLLEALKGTALANASNCSAAEKNLAWCRAACSPAAVGATSTGTAARRMATAFVSSVYWIAVFLAFVLTIYNRDRMLSNPRRAFLYVNLTTMCGQLALLVGQAWPGESGFWCNDDGSVVLGTDTHGMCLVTALLTEIEPTAFVLALGWLCYIWLRTVTKAAAMVRAGVEAAFTKAEKFFLFAFLLLPALKPFLISALATGSSPRLVLEGYPLLRICTFRHSKTARLSPAVTLVISLLVSVCFAVAVSFVFRKKGRGRLRTQMTISHCNVAADKWSQVLRRWTSRHRTIAVFAATYLILYVLHVNYIVKHISSSDDERQATEFERFAKCLASPQCDQRARCRLDAHPLLRKHSQHHIQVVVIQGSMGILTFGWLLFSELRWPGSRWCT